MGWVVPAHGYQARSGSWQLYRYLGRTTEGPQIITTVVAKHCGQAGHSLQLVVGIFNALAVAEKGALGIC